MAKVFDVNYLLGISRLPDHFYPMLHGHVGRDEQYLNPGVSLRSFIIGNCIRREYVELSNEILACAEECDKFSRNTLILSKIVEMLSKRCHDVLNRVNLLPPARQADYAIFVESIRDFAQVAKMSFDAFIMNQDPSLDYVDIDSVHGKNLKSALIDLKFFIDDIDYELNNE
jgi:hypothetical protein